MELKERIYELRRKTGMNRREFFEVYGIPVRTMEEWESGRRTPADYIVRLLAYAIEFDLVNKFRDTALEGNGKTEDSVDGRK